MIYIVSAALWWAFLGIITMRDVIKAEKIKGDITLFDFLMIFGFCFTVAPIILTIGYPIKWTRNILSYKLIKKVQ